ncbi:hypothetical protein AVEN_48200-1 [Araneus ventricosus]|uniref:Uncharacterized protein n=1 Tax=Araneus ventricosus TaxID=182803 RepID=A0A4Y2H0G5_ARAVE|nr:hypothetical protein AVEN_268573-1 [Araneus ventricosus]GBM58631.1 hypothetical protein AVEN_41221-1 [Araneus ventricosus]GBM58632.1 hypothetical protein AVEN_61220-1 [Araneus ventricosus]GBM60284.1 hypothetical protein AVEN_48200-1 [Araneus ventricosus]
MLESSAMRWWTCLQKREVLFLLPPLVNPSRPKYLLSTGLKQILLGKSLPHTNGMLEIVLVCLYSPKVQDPQRLHWSDFVVAISKARNSSTNKRLIPLALVPVLILLLMSWTVLAPLRGCCGVRGKMDLWYC